MSWTYRAVDSDRAKWENAINSAFAAIGSTERVCNHADRTVTQSRHTTKIECDYCPANAVYRSPVQGDLDVPWYFENGS